MDDGQVIDGATYIHTCFIETQTLFMYTMLELTHMFSRPCIWGIMNQVVLALKVVTTWNMPSRRFPEDGDSDIDMEDDEETEARNVRREETDTLEVHDPVMHVSSHNNRNCCIL